MVGHGGDEGAGQHQKDQHTQEHDGGEENPIDWELVLGDMIPYADQLQRDAEPSKQELQEASDRIGWALGGQAQGCWGVSQSLSANHNLVVVHPLGTDAVVVIAHPAESSAGVGDDFAQVVFDVREAACCRHREFELYLFIILRDFLFKL